MSGKPLTEIIRRTDGKQILNVTLNIKSTTLEFIPENNSGLVQLYVTLVRFNNNKSKMYTPQKAEW